MRLSVRIYSLLEAAGNRDMLQTIMCCPEPTLLRREKRTYHMKLGAATIGLLFNEKGRPLIDCEKQYDSLSTSEKAYHRLLLELQFPVTSKKKFG